MKKLFYTILSGILLSSCANLNPLKKFKEGKRYKKADLVSYEEIKGDENVIAGSLIFGPTLNMISPEFMMNFDVGGELKYHNLKFGELTMRYTKPIAFKQSYTKFDYYNSSQLLDQHQFSFSGSFPLYKQSFSKDEHLVPGYDDHHKRYYIISPTNGLKKFNLRLGYEQDYRRTYSDAYTNFLDNEYGEVDYTYSFEHPYAEYNLLQQQFRIGGSYETCFNTNLVVTTKNGETIYGRSAMTNNFYFDILISTGFQSDSIYYDYKTSDGSVTTNHSENVNLTNFIEKRPIGFAIGYETLSFDPKIKFSQSGYLIELGFQPGYYSTIKESFYIIFGLKFGFGYWN